MTSTGDSIMVLIALVSVLTCLVASSYQLVEGDLTAVDEKYTCPHGWTRYGTKKCLKYVNELQDYERAQATCRSKNQGTLVTIHSHDEQNFVYSYIHSIAASSTPIWLGAKQIDFESILWLDKTENSYTNWAASEPSHPDEICIAINPRNGMWHDVMCTEANVPACERAPTTQWPFFVAFCSEGWFQFNDEKCVRIISSQALNFYESQELCRSKYNSKLLSIKTDRESEFLHNLIKFRDVKLPVWLGAVQNDFSSFNWIDKSDVTFTNWAEGEPNDPDHACLSMTASGGKWSDNDCKEQKLILCQKVPEDSSCETGWLQFRQDKCYRFVHIRLAFDDAELLCNNLYGGHLPSIHSQEEQFMISQFLASVNVKNGSEIWLGGRQMDFHNFNWGDGSLFNYSYWEHGEPNFPAEKCIEMSWRNGRWNDIGCRLKRAVLCERQVTSQLSSGRQSVVVKPANPILQYVCLDNNCTTPSLMSATTVPEPISPNQSPAQVDSNSNGGGNGNNELGGSSQTFVLANQTLADAAHPALNSTAGSGNQTNAYSSSSSSHLNVTNRTAPEQSLESHHDRPLDDKPIKVISSIMHREQAPPAEPFLSLNASLAEASSSPGQSTSTSANSSASTGSSTFVHYNLPPPNEHSGQQQHLDARKDLAAESISSATGSTGEPVAAKSSTHPLVSPVVSQQVADSLIEKPNASLLDKIKPQQSSSPSVSSSSSASSTTQLVANSVANAMPLQTSLPPVIPQSPAVLATITQQQQQQQQATKESLPVAETSSSKVVPISETAVAAAAAQPKVIAS